LAKKNIFGLCFIAAGVQKDSLISTIIIVRNKRSRIFVEYIGVVLGLVSHSASYIVIPSLSLARALHTWNWFFVAQWAKLMNFQGDSHRDKNRHFWCRLKMSSLCLSSTSRL